MKHQKSSVVILIALLSLPTHPVASAQTTAPNPAPTTATGRYQPTTIPPTPDDEDEAQEAQQVMDDQNKKSATIYGKAVDQYGQPVAGAQAIATSIFNVSIMASRNEDHFTTTDANGFFQFIGIAGAQVGFGVKKPGYVWNGQGIPPASGQSTPQNRELFVMYKLQGAEPMVHSKFGDWIPYDGTSVGVDLLTGKKSASGDLKVTLTRNPLIVRRGRDHFDWNVSIEVIGGGLVESHDAYAYEAPKDGYQDKFVFSELKNDPHWTQKLIKDFYIHTAQNTYGKIHIDLTTDSDRPDGTGLSVESYINPNPGSHNLEYDETKVAKPQ
jgi:hypothetical protein